MAPASSSAAPKSEAAAGKDPLLGDIQATPGSILSQYTPQESRDLDTKESESALPKRDEYVSSADRKRDRMARIFSWGFLLGLVGGGVYLGRPLDQEEQQRVGWGDVPRFCPAWVTNCRYQMDIPLEHTGNDSSSEASSCLL